MISGFGEAEEFFVTIIFLLKCAVVGKITRYLGHYSYILVNSRRLLENFAYILIYLEKQTKTVHFL